MSERPKRGGTSRKAAPTSSAKSASRASGRKAAAAQATRKSDVRSSGRASRSGGQDRREVQQSSAQDDLSASGEPLDAIVVEQPAQVESPGKFSGTTARTSMNSNRGQNVAASIILVDNLAQLDRAASDVLALLTPRENNSEALAKITSTFQDDTRTRGRSLRHSRQQFHEVRKFYGEESYINVNRAVTETLGLSGSADLEDGPWRPDDIFFRANLAAAAEETQQRRKSDGQFDPALGKMERDFPELFLYSVVASAKAKTRCGISRLANETFLMALDIRVQFAIDMLIENQASSTSGPEGILRPIFYENTSHRGWSVDGLRTEQLSQLQKTKMADAFEKLKSEIAQGNKAHGNLNATHLKQLYPIEKFVGKYLTWIRARSSEISASLATLDNALGVQEAVEELLESRGQDSVVGQQGSESGPLAHGSVQETAELTPARKEAIQHRLKHLSPNVKAGVWNNTFQSTQLASTAPAIQSNLRQSVGASPSRARAHAQPETEPTSLPANQAKDMVSKFRRDLADGDKENAKPAKGAQSKDHQHGKSYIDAQANAERLTFDTQADSLDAPIYVEQDGELLEDPSQDAGFEQDTRAASNKRSAATIREAPRAKRVRILPAEETHLASSNPGIVGGSTRPQDYIEANQAAKARTRVHSSQRPAQRRKPWTFDETTHLLEAIEEVGTSWSTIKRLDTTHRFRDRDQVALKDKARNLLFDYLKAGQDLPPNFDKIALNAMQKNQLRNLGIVLPEDF